MKIKLIVESLVLEWYPGPSGFSLTFTGITHWSHLVRCHIQGKNPSCNVLSPLVLWMLRCPLAVGKPMGWASQVALVVKNPPANAGDIRDRGSIPGWGRSPGGGHGNPVASILAWRIPWAEEPGGQHSIGLQRVGISWSDSAHRHPWCILRLAPCPGAADRCQATGSLPPHSLVYSLLLTPVTQNLQPNHCLNHWCSLQGLFANSVGHRQVECLGLGLRNPSVWEKV